MKIKIEYDIDTTSRYDYEPSFRTVKKVYNVDGIDAEDYMNELKALPKLTKVQKERLNELIKKYEL